MEENQDFLEVFWDNLLSRRPERVRAVFATLRAAERQAVLAHLQRMASEPGWQPEQRESALAALQILRDWR